MRLSGWAFIIVGLAVAGISLWLFIDGKKMGLFILAGIAMTVFGIIRVYIDREDPQMKKPSEPLIGSAGTPNQPAPARISLRDIPRVCGTCGARNNPRANYCGNCGGRIN